MQARSHRAHDWAKQSPAPMVTDMIGGTTRCKPRLAPPDREKASIRGMREARISSEARTQITLLPVSACGWKWLGATSREAGAAPAARRRDGKKGSSKMKRG